MGTGMDKHLAAPLLYKGSAEQVITDIYAYYLGGHAVVTRGNSKPAPVFFRK
jgi:hypothetical protein